MAFSIEVAKSMFNDMFQAAKLDRNLVIERDVSHYDNSELLYAAYDAPLDEDWQNAFVRVSSNFGWSEVSSKFNTRTDRIELVLSRTKPRR